MDDVPLTEIPAGHLGAVVTFLEMAAPPPLRPMPDSPLRLKPWPGVTPAQYRRLFARVGTRWLWFSRLAMDDAALASAICELHAVVDRSGVEVGMLELDFAKPGECLVRFLGLVPELAGKGHGRWLLAQALALAWRKGVTRVHLHTCTLDHPAALPAYLAAGFRVHKRAFETLPDPRLTGLLPRDAAPQVPLALPREEHG